MMRSKGHSGKRMRIFLAVLCLLCLWFSFATVNASAADTAKVTVSSSEVERGETATVSFDLEGNPGIWGLKLRVKYDTSVLTLKTVTAGSVFAEKELTLSETKETEPYVIVALGDSLKNKTKNGTIATLKFAVSKNAAYKSYPIKVDVVQVINEKGDNVRTSGVDGSVKVEKSTVTPPDQPGDEPGDEPGNQPGDEPGDEPGDQPGDEPGDQPGDEPEDQPGDEPDDQPGDEPEDEDSLDGDASLDNEDADANADADENENEDADTDADADVDEDEEDESGIATGDGNVILPYIIVLAAAMLGFVVVLKKRRG